MDVLSASLVRRPLEANIRGDEAQNMLLQKEMLDAEAWQVSPQDIGVANISSSGSMRFDDR